MKRTFTIFIVILLAAVAAAAQGYSRAKLWDAEINELTAIDRKQTPPADAVLFVGSSSIRMWTDLRESFPRLPVINRGFGGSRLADVVYYFDRIVAPYAPKAIVLYAGDNDINDGIAPEQVLEDYRAFAALVRAKFPKAKLFYIALKPSPSRWKLAGPMRRANELIKAEIAGRKRAKFVDVWSAMLDARGEPRPELFLDDKLHLNEQGYRIWRDILTPLLR